MNLRTNSIKIPKENPFKNCQLDREQYADILTTIIKSYDEGFVLALNNPWGAGKTTFVNMWRQKLINKGFTTIYFNAWENDYNHDPLVAITGEFKSLLNIDNKNSFNKILKHGGKIIAASVPSIVMALASHYGLDKAVTSTLEAVADESFDVFKNELEKYTERKDNISQFRSSLTQFIAQTTLKKPVIIFIDELDRCKPNYAVELLESIKHIFSVPGLTFVLSVHKDQLCEAVKGAYGSSGIDANEYLRKFFDLEYTIKAPNPLHYWEFLYKNSTVKDFFEGPLRSVYPELQQDGISVLETGALLTHSCSLNLRQIESIFNKFRIVIRSFKYENFVFPSFLVFLIYINEFKSQVFKTIIDSELTVPELISIVLTVLPKPHNLDLYPSFYKVLAELMFFYDLRLGERINFLHSDTGFIFNKVQELTKKDEDFIVERLAALDHNPKVKRIPMKYFIDKIELINKIVI